MSGFTTDSHGSGSVPESVRVDHGRGDRTPSSAVVEAVARLAGVDAEALGEEANIVLYDHVDPDALDAFVTGCLGDVDLSFSVAEYAVRVDADAVVARPAE